jgi:uncharacterized protein
MYLVFSFMDYFVICTIALVASALTFFSGFGLGTILTPAFGIFFPIELAIALTAIVHFLNNVFKLFLVGKHADRNVVIKFGIPSLLAAIVGAWLLTLISDIPAITSYHIGTHSFAITPVKLTISALLVFFVLFDVIPGLAAMTFDRRCLVAGGLLSGFFGGVSGNQGALRSAFLIKSGLTKEAFIATGVVVACMVDVARLSVYAKNILNVQHLMNYNLVIAATISAFTGAFIGSKLIKKITIKKLQYIVAVFLFVFAVLLGAGII